MSVGELIPGWPLDRSDAERVQYRTFRPASLPPAQAAELFDSMRKVASAATIGPLGSTWIDADWESRRIQFEESTCYSAWSSEGLIGFMWTRRVSVESWRAVHLQAAYVLPEHHGRGIGFAMNARMVLREAVGLLGPRSLLVADMASPVAFHGWRSRARRAADFFPLLDGSGRPLRSPLEQVAVAMSSGLYPGVRFDSSTGTLRSKTAGRVGPVRMSGEHEVDAYFADFVSGSQGDTALVVMRPSATEFAANAGEVIKAVPRAIRRNPRRSHRQALAHVSEGQR
jgi:hypothetical protein